MRNLIFLLVIFLSACKEKTSSFEMCFPNTLSNGIIAAYSFSDGSLSDISDNGNDLTNQTTASPATDRNGAMGCAYQFNNATGGSEYLNIANPSFMNAKDIFSISLWYSPTDPNRQNGKFETLISRGTGTQCPDKSGEWSVGLYDCGRAVFGHENSVWQNYPGGECQNLITTNLNQWHHVVAVKSDDNYKLYYNGEFQEIANGIAGCNIPPTSQDIGELLIGENFDGYIDDVLIYDRNLSPFEIQILYSLEPCCN